MVRTGKVATETVARRDTRRARRAPTQRALACRMAAVVVLVPDNGDLRKPNRRVVEFEDGKTTLISKPTLRCLAPLL